MKQLILSALIFIGIIGSMTYFINTTQAGRRCDEQISCDLNCTAPTIILTPTVIIKSDPISTPSATPTVTPTNSNLTENRVHITEPKPDGSKSAPTCDVTIPDKPNHIVADRGVINDHKLSLLWPRIVNATHINIYYGEYGRPIEHGVANLPDTGNFEIGALKNRTNYLFCIEGVNRCAVGPMLCIDPQA